VSKKKYNELGQYYENIEYDLKKSRAEVADLKHQLALQKALGGKQEELPITTYKFDKLTHDFGTIAIGVEYTTTFKFTNTGDEKLVFTTNKIRYNYSQYQKENYCNFGKRKCERKIKITNLFFLEGF